MAVPDPRPLAEIEPTDFRTPPLGGVVCPDPVWSAGRTLWIQGLDGMLGPRWIVMLDGAVGVAAPGPPVPPTPPTVLPEGPEGAVPYLDILETP
jgi:hypothetical protein